MAKPSNHESVYRMPVHAVVGGRAARAIDWDVEFVGPIATFESEVAEAEGGVANGFYAMTSFEFPYADHPRQEVRDFVADYEERYGQEPNSGSLFGWLFADFMVTS